MTAPRRFPPPWSVEELTESFVIRDASGQALAYVYFEGRGRSSSDHDRLTREESGNFKPRTCFANKGGSGQNPNLLSSRLLLTRAAASASDVEQRPPQLAASFNSTRFVWRHSGVDSACFRESNLPTGSIHPPPAPHGGW
jgi:hypothetical protein